MKATKLLECARIMVERQSQTARQREKKRPNRNLHVKTQKVSFIYRESAYPIHHSGHCYESFLSEP